MDASIIHVCTGGWPRSPLRPASVRMRMCACVRVFVCCVRACVCVCVCACACVAVTARISGQIAFVIT